MVDRGVVTDTAAETAPRVRWHPPRAVLELAELVVDGALPVLPLPGLLGTEDGAPDDVREAWHRGSAVDLEDAEGTPVARVGPDGDVGSLRPFAHGPLRGRRRTPVQVRDSLADLRADDRADRPAAATADRVAAAGVTAVLVTGPLPEVTVERVVRAAADAGHALVWFAVVGAGPAAPLPPAALLRAVGALAEATRAAGGHALALPLALPRSADGGPADPDLARRVAAAYGADAVADLTPSPGAAAEPHPAFGAELDRRRGARRGVTVFFTGLSGSGKSTVAKALADRLLDDGRRDVTLLDGDEVRRLLSHGLGFSRADRDLNIRRIGFVAAEVSRHGGVAVAAPIAPFDAVRAEVRDLVEAAGGDFLLVHVATPLQECERRDRKGLYARARRGEIADFTGISSPYEMPARAELVVDTTGRAVDDVVAQVWQLLDERGHLGSSPGARRS